MYTTGNGPYRPQGLLIDRIDLQSSSRSELWPHTYSPFRGLYLVLWTCYQTILGEHPDAYSAPVLGAVQVIARRATRTLTSSHGSLHSGYTHSIEDCFEYPMHLQMTSCSENSCPYSARLNLPDGVTAIYAHKGPRQGEYIISYI